jgi:aerobic carbon-monoxide dehydrogenase medium subunit
MYSFTFERPTSNAAALTLGASGGRFLAGGQTLLASMKLRLSASEQIVDLSGIPELVGVCADGHGDSAAVVIGAMTRHADVARHPLVQAEIPALAELAGGIGDAQVRSLGTLGGAVANNDPAACYPAAVLALGATVNTLRADGSRRQIAADDFFLGMFATALEEGELISSIRFPLVRRAAYLKFKQSASRFAMVGVFVACTPTGVRVAVTGAGNGVFRHAGLEAALNHSFTPELAAAVVIDASDLNADIHASAAYRANLISVQTQRAVAKLV